MTTKSYSFASEILVEDNPLDDIRVTSCVQFNNTIVNWPASVIDTSPAHLDRSSTPPRNSCENSPTSSYIWLLEITVNNQILRPSD